MSNNSDAVFAVRFYQAPYHMTFRSQQEGRPIYEMRDHVRIEIPGNQLSIIDTLANDDHKAKFPLQWAHYQNSQTGRDDASLQGTLLREWPLLTAAQAKELEHWRFYTVEQVANASDLQLQSVGMLAGMSPLSFRDKARAFLASAKDSAAVQQQADELAQSRAREKALQESMGELMRKVEELSKQVEGQEVRRGPGRPRKEEANAS